MTDQDDIRTYTIEQLEKVYAGLPDKRSLCAQALAEVIAERQRKSDFQCLTLDCVCGGVGGPVAHHVSRSTLATDKENR